ncbi:MAG: hypothetical protein HOV87_12190 [Catenulispora sp.]|nr:hypothetical protein [Catenulispora sp.]NUT39993.1 hypothetical protein [Thermoactinospora sp.]
MTGPGAPLLGHLVLYSIFDGEVTRDDLVRWFTELQLDPQFVPAQLRPVDAYERVTGPDGVRVSYPLPLVDPGDVIARTGRKTTGRAPGRGVVRKQATLMVRPVTRDGGQIVRHIVREVRDEEQTRLSYDTCLGSAIFRRDNDVDEAGAGELLVEPQTTAIAELPDPEQAVVRHMLTHLQTEYRHRCTYVSGDKLRGVIRTYIESLNAVRVRPTGGVYFVHAQHAHTLTALRELVSRFAAGSHLVRIPLPDADEMREMVINAFTTKAKDDLDKLARDIATAQHQNAGDDTIQKLYSRFAELQQATTEHASLLSTTLDDTTAALDLVKLQLGSFLATAGDGQD